MEQADRVGLYCAEVRERGCDGGMGLEEGVNFPPLHPLYFRYIQNICKLNIIYKKVCLLLIVFISVFI